jgi:deoxycytidylate deaminase
MTTTEEIIKMVNLSWARYFRGIAGHVKQKSKDKYTQIGAVIVGKDNEIVSTGYNSFPRGINDDVHELVYLQQVVKFILRVECRVQIVHVEL